MRVLLIEDDKSLGRAVRDHLVNQNNAIDWAENLEDAYAAVSTTRYDFILLDLRLPDGSGLDFLKNIRTKNLTSPVVILTAHDQISERIEGLNSGADDYIVKPFDLYELTARIGAVARRTNGLSKSEIKIGSMTLDMENKRIFIDDKEVELSSREWAIIEHMASHPNMLVTKAQIEDTIYAFGSEVESNTVEVYISRLRKKIGKDRIKTHHGRGYSLC
ncbi:response regulator transcription factor [Bartonella sp. W8122]|uniref:Two component transcriptional regulator, winged helix family n=1 Tax=Bartonella apihabitans TaxID=2750929 RepID=A0A1U9M9X7_9HYPH|nr:MULTISPECIES: response regulator transcription factor [Bartonella]AQT42123.1 two component transcriptional regulator, winged helix family [Bartonella apihabitans]AQT44357.1 two component transcriptional regulator, winged helix family [Bartonella apihabitans]MBI0001067.1 response regulator transcription factor [Bartonella sp. W8122]MBI0019779.1 response regulator transcription factor [Bartonella apihabitans]MBI0025545.1 response regulator transcription factor [Bartonella apihabitans]